MAFLDNSGDIILDAVLTDTGRMRLAKGDGSFKIVKFALGDDEINYEIYNSSHASGSAYYDLEILQTPVLEAFTNNTSVMKSKLISISRTNLLYLPILKLNEKNNGNKSTVATQTNAKDTFLVAVNSTTEDRMGGQQGTMHGENTSQNATTARVDQGLDTTAFSPAFSIDADLVETQYIIELDNRFGVLTDRSGNDASVSFIDDDNIASYYLAEGTNAAFVERNQTTTTSTQDQVIQGPRGTILQFAIRSSLDLNSSNYLFDQLGSTVTLTDVDSDGTTSGTSTYYYIDATVRVTGVTTGYRVDLPLRFIKFKTD
jgi:hypothetical protein